MKIYGVAVPQRIVIVIVVLVICALVMGLVSGIFVDVATALEAVIKIVELMQLDV